MNPTPIRTDSWIWQHTALAVPRNLKKKTKVKTSNLSKAHETHDSLSSSYSLVVLIYLYPYRHNSLLKSMLQPQIAKNTKTPILEVQGHSRSSMFTLIKSLSLLLVMISSMSVVLVYLQPFRRNLLLKFALQPKIASPYLSATIFTLIYKPITAK